MIVNSSLSERFELLSQLSIAVTRTCLAYFNCSWSHSLTSALKSSTFGSKKENKRLLWANVYKKSVVREWAFSQKKRCLNFFIRITILKTIRNSLCLKFITPLRTPFACYKVLQINNKLCNTLYWQNTKCFLVKHMDNNPTQFLSCLCRDVVKIYQITR